MSLWDSGLWDTAKWSVNEATFSVALDDISVTSTGKTAHTGPLSVSLDDVGLSANGTIVHNAAFDITLEDVNVSIAGVTAHAGPLQIALDDILFNSSGIVTRYADLSITLDDIAFSAIGQHGEVDDFAVRLDDVRVQIEGSVIPPIPVSVQTRGGTDKPKKNYRNQREDVERDVAKAINKVFGIEDPKDFVEAESTKELPAPDYSAKVRELMLEAQANAFEQTIEQYEQASIQAELDDEEAILLLL